MNFLRKLLGRSGDRTSPDQEPWLTGEKLYEGFPLLLRRPASVDYASLPPKLLIITHHLEKTKPNGLPEPDYNDTLADFDLELVRYLPAKQAGRIVLVETFGHKRHYYAYGGAAASAEEIRRHFESRFPGFRIESSERADPEAGFIRKYAADHF